MYVFARVVVALAEVVVLGSRTMTTKGGGGDGDNSTGRVMMQTIETHSWQVFAAMSWGLVMWLFRWYPEQVQPSLRSSMKYMYVFFPFFSLSPFFFFFLWWWYNRKKERKKKKEKVKG